jgi:hypothetical protein
VDVSQHLSLAYNGKAPEGVGQGQNRTREIRPSGIEKGASGNVAMGAGLRTTAKVVEKPPDPKVRAPEIYLTAKKLGVSCGV